MKRTKDRRTTTAVSMIEPAGYATVASVDVAGAHGFSGGR